MRGIRRSKRMSVATVAAALALLGAGSVPAIAAEAVQWNPQDTVEPVTLASGSELVITGDTGSTVTCQTVTTNVMAPVNGDPAVAGTVDSSGNAASPMITNCTNSLFPLAETTVTTSGQWLATATSTSSANISNASATVDIGGLCTVTIENVSINDNAWSNNSHQLKANSNGSFPISQNSCDGAATATLSGTLQLPDEVTIS